jgi:hypothetical protein
VVADAPLSATSAWPGALVGSEKGTPRAAPAQATAVQAGRTVLPRSGLEVSRIGLGLAHLHVMPAPARVALIERALELGITHFDTSRFYSDGLSEATLGRVLGARRAQVTIATKFGLLPTPFIASAGVAAMPLRKLRSLLKKLRLVPYPMRSYTAATMRRALEDSLRALRTDTIDIYHVHEPPPDTRLEDTLRRELERARSAGKIRFVGISGASIDPVVARHPGLFDVLQSAEATWAAGRSVPDITHSVLSGAAGRDGRVPPDVVRELMHRALLRRPQGAVIVQTRSPERLAELVALAQGR